MSPFSQRSSSFLKGLLFVAVAYILIKLIDHYQVFFNGVKMLTSALWPFVLSFGLAYILNPILVFLEKQFKLKRGWSVTITYCGLILVCYIGASFLFPVIYQSAKDLMSQIPIYATEIQNWLMTLGPEFAQINLEEMTQIQGEILNVIPKLTEVFTSSLGSLVSVLYQAIMGTGNVLLAFIISIYVLVEKEKFALMTKKLIYVVCRPQVATHIFNAASLFHTNIGKYLIGKSIDSIFVAVCAIIGLSLIGAKYAVLLGVIFGITNMIPFVGPIFGTAIVVVINLFYSPLVALISLVFLLIVQQVETLVIDPKVVGKQMGLSPFFTILAVTIGGQLMGIFGMILGVPIMGVLKLYLTQFINREYEKLSSKVSDIPLK